MTKVYCTDASLDMLRGKTLAIIGYGNQGTAKTQTMMDSGLNVIIGLDQTLAKSDGSWKRAKGDGFEVFDIQKAAEKGNIVHMLIPDLEKPEIYNEDISKNMTEGKSLGFSHGFGIHFKEIVPPSNVDVVMVAPKSPGFKVRERYLNSFVVPALVAVYQDYSGHAKKTALALSRAIGCSRAGVLETTFKEETESDLIGEQTVFGSRPYRTNQEGLRSSCGSGI